MKKTFTLTLALVMCSHLLWAQQIDSASSPRVWLRADQSTLGASQWNDVSFYKNHAVSAGSSLMPTPTASMNFNKAIYFDGIDDYLKIPYSLEGLADFSIFAVFQSADTVERGIWGSEQSLSRSVFLTTRKSIGPDTIADLYGRTENRAALNTVMQNWEKATTLSGDAYMALGSAGKTRGVKPFKGALAELIVFGRALTFVERLHIETYLAIKYGTGLTDGNFLSSSDQVLWKVSENRSFGRNIAGIGRDDHFKLYQKQSASAYDSGLLQINAGQLATTNELNHATINDKDFILWGDNGLALKNRKGEGVDSVLAVLQRKWLVTVNGGTARNMPLEIRLDTTMLPSNAEGYWLVIDRSGQGDFGVDNLEYILPDRREGSKVIYKNVRFDIDGSGKDNFGFAKAAEFFAVVRTLKEPSCTDETAGKIRIQVIQGTGPYLVSLESENREIKRSWRQSNFSSVQEELFTGNYTVKLEDDNGETLKRSFSLEMPDALHFDLGADRDLLTEQNIILDISNQIPDSIDVAYRWENNFGFSSDSKSISVTEAGIYHVYVTKQSDGCTFSDHVAVAGSEQERVAVYPTFVSTSERYNVSVSLDEPGSVLVKVFNSRGLQVYEARDTGKSEFQFVTSMREPGMYLVVIQTPNGVESRKVVVY